MSARSSRGARSEPVDVSTAMLKLDAGSWRVLRAAASIHPETPVDAPNACGDETGAADESTGYDDEE